MVALGGLVGLCGSLGLVGWLGGRICSLFSNGRMRNVRTAELLNKPRKQIHQTNNVSITKPTNNKSENRSAALLVADLYVGFLLLSRSCNMSTWFSSAVFIKRIQPLKVSSTSASSTSNLLTFISLAFSIAAHNACFSGEGRRSLSPRFLRPPQQIDTNRTLMIL